MSINQFEAAGATTYGMRHDALRAGAMAGTIELRFLAYPNDKPRPGHTMLLSFALISNMSRPVSVTLSAAVTEGSLSGHLARPTFHPDEVVDLAAGAANSVYAAVRIPLRAQAGELFSLRIEASVDGVTAAAEDVHVYIPGDDPIPMP